MLSQKHIIRSFLKQILVYFWKFNIKGGDFYIVILRLWLLLLIWLYRCHEWLLRGLLWLIRHSCLFFLIYLRCYFEFDWVVIIFHYLFIFFNWCIFFSISIWFLVFLILRYCGFIFTNMLSNLCYAVLHLPLRLDLLHPFIAHIVFQAYFSPVSGKRLHVGRCTSRKSGG